LTIRVASGAPDACLGEEKWHHVDLSLPNHTTNRPQ
jgi:hypothetical protein